MGKIKTLCVILTLTAHGSAAPAQDAFLHHVTTCVGRMSAQMEHNWMFQDVPSDQIELQRAHLIDILDSMTTSDNAGRILSRRIEAKFAHSSLLTQAAFAGDTRMRAHADRRASANIQACADIMLLPAIETPPAQMSMSDVQSGDTLVNRRAIQATKSRQIGKSAP